MVVDVEIKRLPEAKDLPLPSYATPGSAGMDLMAAVDEDVVIQPRERKLISTGIAIAVPPGYEAQIRPRSGLALKYGLSMVNTPGTIDSDYRGTVQVILINHGSEPFTVKRGDRIAQMVITPVVQARLVERENLDETVRNDGGFGHTGVGNCFNHENTKGRKHER